MLIVGSLYTTLRARPVGSDPGAKFGRKPSHFSSLGEENATQCISEGDPGHLKGPPLSPDLAQRHSPFVPCGLLRNRTGRFPLLSALESRHGARVCRRTRGPCTLVLERAFNGYIQAGIYARLYFGTEVNFFMGGSPA